jgi:hypothetical protein
MPIGRAETDRVWTEAYEPTARSCSLNPIRIDKEDDGTLLTPQIVHILQVAPLLIADLTFARPNCYYEVGYAHGLDRERNMILCCREDHIADSPRFDAARNKVHFDLQNYGILFWDPAHLNAFAHDLRLKIEKRLEILHRQTVTKGAAARDTPAARSATKTAELEEKLRRLTEREERLAAKWKKRS